MRNVYNFMDEKITPVASKISNQRHLSSVRDGLIMAMPLLIIGSFFLILAYLPISGYPEFMENMFGGNWQTKLTYPVSVTYDIMALLVSFGIAYRLAEKYGTIDAVMTGVFSMVCFALTVPQHVMFTPEGSQKALEVGGVLPTAQLGSQGLFVAIVISILSTEIYRFFYEKDFVIKMPDSVPPAVWKSFSALIPGTITILVIWGLRLLIEVTPFESMNNIVSIIIGIPMQYVGGTLLGMIVIVSVIGVLWSVGLHGDAILSAFTTPIWLKNMDENRAAFQVGKEIPNIFTQQFYELFICIGGTGALFSIVMLMLWRSKSQQMKELGRVAAPASVFNISEPVIFGVPIVLNPYLFIPFFMTPIILVIVTYFAMKTGLVARPVGIALPWTTPPIISGYLATGGKISGAVMQIVNILIALVIYYPFFRIWDKQKYREESDMNEKINRDVEMTL
ncbi:oligo-beta-mannoside permease IIC protein [Peribacillus simplex]|uniref:Permease IIC component n=2 Tax=Peribacillus TaxID=2675229 RepID=A0A120GNW6_9BACI|nr:oligo-beta-mannoside permease IIC protein [Peribacillus simplex]